MDGIQLDSADNCTMSNNLIVGVENNGILCGGHSGSSENSIGNSIINNKIVGENATTNVGIMVAWNTHDTQIVGNYITECYYLGIEATSPKTLRTNIVGNTITVCPIGVYVEKQANFTNIQANFIYYATSQGIYILNASYCNIGNNYIYYSGYGIYLKSCNYTAIVGNYVYDTLSRPVIESATGLTCDYNLLDGNSFIKYGSAKQWGSAGHDVTGDNLEVQNP